MKKNDILFSIIVPVYNTEKYIEKCLNSILKAIDTDCEVILVNDGSKDNSEKVIKEFINKLPEEYKDNFIYKYKENKGLADTKNVGISLARGKYISVVDSDDYISDDFYKVARRYIEEGYEIIIYDLYIIFEQNYAENYCKQMGISEKIDFHNYVARAFNDEKDIEKTAILCGAMQGSSCNKIIKKELYNDYKFPTNKEYEDTAVTPFILMDTDKIKYVPYPLYYYLQRAKSIVGNNTYITAFYKICENISNELKSKNDYKIYDEVINEFFIERALDTMYADYIKGKKQFWNKLDDFSEKNQNTIKYILEKNMIYEYKNHYTERQKGLLKDIYEGILNKQYNKVKKAFLLRKIVNYIRRFLRSFKDLGKAIIGR